MLEWLITYGKDEHLLPPPHPPVWSPQDVPMLRRYIEEAAQPNPTNYFAVFTIDPNYLGQIRIRFFIRIPCLC